MDANQVHDDDYYKDNGGDTISCILQIRSSCIVMRYTCKIKMASSTYTYEKSLPTPNIWMDGWMDVLYCS